MDRSQRGPIRFAVGILTILLGAQQYYVAAQENSGRLDAVSSAFYWIIFMITGLE